METLELIFYCYCWNIISLCGEIANVQIKTLHDIHGCQKNSLLIILISSWCWLMMHTVVKGKFKLKALTWFLKWKENVLSLKECNMPACYERNATSLNNFYRILITNNFIYTRESNDFSNICSESSILISKWNLSRDTDV